MIVGLQGKFNKIADQMRKYASQIQKSPFVVKNLNLYNEAEKFLKFFARLERYIENNKSFLPFETNPSDLIEVVFSSDYTQVYDIIYIPSPVECDPGDPYPIRITLPAFRQNQSITTLALVHKLSELFDIFDKQYELKWDEFVLNYIIPKKEI